MKIDTNWRGRFFMASAANCAKGTAKAGRPNRGTRTSGQHHHSVEYALHHRSAALADVPGRPCEEYGVGGLFLGPTIRFQLLDAILMLAHDRLRILQFASPLIRPAE